MKHISWLGLLASNTSTAVHCIQLYGLFSLAPQPFASWGKSWEVIPSGLIFYFFFSLELFVSNNWHALERYLISDWNVLRCDRAIQVSAVWKRKTKQTLKTQWSTWSRWGIFLLMIPWISEVYFLIFAWCNFRNFELVMCDHVHDPHFATGTWLIFWSCSSVLASFLLMCVWHVQMSNGKVLANRNVSWRGHPFFLLQEFKH